MEGKRRIHYCILALFVITSFLGCTIDKSADGISDSAKCNITLTFGDISMDTRASIPDENMIRDLNVAIFDGEDVERVIWKPGLTGSVHIQVTADLIKGKTYTFFAVANLGRRMEVNNIHEIKDMDFELSESGEFTHGIPMSSLTENILIKSDEDIRIDMTRMAAKISLRIDRSRLSDGVDMTIRSVRIGNCPKFASFIGPSKVSTIHDRLETGFELTQEQCMPLDKIGKGSISEYISVYMLENMQGPFPYAISEAEEKVLDKEDTRYSLSSFIELEIYYSSKELISYDSNLIYRFYLGEGLNDLNIERNCHYRITVCPEDDGLSGGGWRVDKSGIGPSTPYFKMMPGEYVKGHVGDTLRIWCECYPKTAPFDPGHEELKYDKRRGIYDYMVDEDGHGVTLYLKKAGTGLVYMTAGEPINESGMVLVSVLP